MAVIADFLAKIGFSVDDRQLHGVEGKLEGIKHAVEFLAASELVKGLFELSERFTALGEQLESSAISAGITTDQLQKLQYAASQNAVGTEQLNGAMARLARILDSAQRGGKQATEAFARIGITPEQLAGLTNSEDAFYAIQDAINATAKTATERIGLLQTFFGRGNASMAKFIQLGSKQTRELGEDAVRIGAVISQTNIKNLAELEDKISGAKLVMRGFLATVGATFAPVFIDAIESIERSWTQNQEAVKQAIFKFATSAAYIFGFLFESIRLIVATIARFVRENQGLVAWIIKIYIALKLLGAALQLFEAGFRYYELAKKFIKLGPELLGLMSKLWTRLAAFATNPAVLEIAGIAVAVTAISLAMATLFQIIFQQKSLKDTWLGQLSNFALKKFGFSGFDDAPAASESSPSALMGAKSAIAKYAEPGRAVDGLASMFGQAYGMQPGAVRQSPATALMSPVTTRQEQSTGIAQPVAVTSPITINVPPGTSQEQAVKMSRDGARQGLLEALNSAQRSFPKARAY